jgi:hypothetical protein
MISNTIYIQLDNATPHAVDPVAFNLVCDGLGLDCRLVYQPPQSPDFNICDLSFFPAIQSIFYKQENVNNRHRLIAAVEESFRIYDCNKLNRAFLSLFQNYNCVLKHHGDNKYPVPHMGKEALERRGMLPVFIDVEFPQLDDVLEGELQNQEEYLTELENFDWEDENNTTDGRENVDNNYNDCFCEATSDNEDTEEESEDENKKK